MCDVGILVGSSDCSSSMFECAEGTVVGSEKSVESFDFAGCASDYCASVSGADSICASALSGSAVTAHEVCFNAMVDVVGTRTCIGNVRTSCGGLSVHYLRVTTVESSVDVSEVKGPLCEVALTTELIDCEVIGESTKSCGTADASTLCGGVGST